MSDRRLRRAARTGIVTAMTIGRDIDRRWVIGGAALSILPLASFGSWAAPAPGVVTPEMFGAKGDGRTDDSAAFAAMSAQVSMLGGGTVELRRTTYLVGTQRTNAVGAPTITQLMEFVGCLRPLVIRGNGARLRCAAGQAYGPHDPEGRPILTALARGQRMVKLRPYSAMILVADCHAPIKISNLELDGNAEGLNVVPRPDGGAGSWQYPCSGIALRNNSGSETLSDIFSHDHALDGFYIDGHDGPTPGAVKRFAGLRADRNGRQGMSIVGGHDYRVERCAFTRTGAGRIATAPRAGLDIEAERGKKIRNLDFVDCRFVDNRGCGMVADTGDSADVRFAGCTFVGTTNWSAWPDKPGFRFARCLFVGTIVRAFGSDDPALAAQFTDCRFSDDAKLSPTGKVLLRNELIADIPKAKNALFLRCTFTLTGDGVLPWSAGVIWQDCTFSQVAAKAAHTRGTFRGTNRITGPVDIRGSAVEGRLIINGKLIAPRPARTV